MRAWERRYQLLTPQRGENRYRLYSDQDIAIVTWVKAKVDGEMQISAASRLVKEMRRTGNWPEVSILMQPEPICQSSQPAADFIAPLHQALIEKKEAAATALLNEVRGQYSLAEIFNEIFIPVLVRIGQAWYEGRIGVSTEHFASSLIRGWVLQIFLFPSRPQHRKTDPGGHRGRGNARNRRIVFCLFAARKRLTSLIISAPTIRWTTWWIMLPRRRQPW